MGSLSVVIPTHNRPALLRRAAESALAEGAEVAIVDDASDADVESVLADLPADRVRYHRVPENRGPCHARNLGVEMASGDLVLFLDDDDEILPGGGERIRALAERAPDVDLYLHNCVYPDGRPSIPTSTPPTPCRYDEWIGGRFRVELKPVVRRELFDSYQFPDTGASGEGLLWGRVIRDRNALVSGDPVVRYDDSGGDRLTRATGLLKRREENARIADEWLAEFGADEYRVNPAGWADRVLAAATYHLLCGRRRRAAGLVRAVPPEVVSPKLRAGLLAATLLPTQLARLLYLAHRGELIASVRRGDLRAALRGGRPGGRR